MESNRFFKPFVVVSLIMAQSVLADNTSPPSNIDSAMYFQAAVRDAEYCSMKLTDGQLQAVNKYNGKLISNPAMTCPDMFSWKLFAEVVTDRFWSEWADEQQNWPAQPYPLCQQGQDPKSSQCCSPGSANNNTEHCPVYPGRQFRKQLTAFTKASGDRAIQQAKQPELKRHTRLPFHENLNPLTSVLPHNTHSAMLAAGEQITSCSAVPSGGTTRDMVPDIMKAVNPADSESIGRVIRQTNAELTVRNFSFHDYLFRNNLYNANGVLDIYFNNQANLQQEAPYRRENRSAIKDTSSQLYKIDLPSDAIMIKSNWLHHKIAETLRMAPDDTQYASKYLATIIDLHALGLSETKGTQCNLEGTHYLVAFHISSKDIPNWVWTTFEHIALPGRCDITGCNDAYGYRSTSAKPAGTADNYIVPNQRSDRLNQSSVVFNSDAGYPQEAIKAELQQVFRQMKIGVSTSADPAEPSYTDSAWLNYRLKGSQVEYVNAVGQPTFLGNSVTEAGFMDGSSCISCHSRAGVSSLGQSKEQVRLTANNVTKHFLALSVFESSLTDYGYFRSHHGIPNPGWYYRDNNSSPYMEVMQLDFIWGFLNAQPLTNP